MEVTVTGGCPTASCPVDLNPNCPSEIQDTDSTGAIIGCRSSCQAGLASDPGASSGHAHAHQTRCSTNVVLITEQYQPTLRTAAPASTTLSTLARPLVFCTTITSVRFPLLLPLGAFDSWHCALAEGNCPDAYGYAFDEPSGTALWTCASATAASYTITFCP